METLVSGMGTEAIPPSTRSSRPLRFKKPIGSIDTAFKDKDYHPMPSGPGGLLCMSTSRCTHCWASRLSALCVVSVEISNAFAQFQHKLGPSFSDSHD
jgi:hypothetical protein